MNRNKTHIVEDEVTFVSEEPMEDDAAFTGRELMEDEVHNFDSYDACNVNAINDHLIYYDWLANNATTNIKGAYLNAILQETIYMLQLEGHEDGTGQVCRLIKMIYGLKQAGCEWNRLLDQKLR